MTETESKEKRHFKVLAIDGGGIKGLFSAQVLAKFEEAFGTKVTDCFDLICGTSTGGIIALGASLGIPMKDVVRFYEEKGPAIFAESSKKTCIGKIRFLLRQVGLFGKYDSKELEGALKEVFGEKTMADCNNLMCIPAYNLNSARGRVFKKDYNQFTEDNSKLCVDVALATAAAPTYLPVKEIDGDQFVDGGVWANNPSMVGFNEYLYQFANDERFDGVEILSISSCEVAKGAIHKKTKRGFIRWASALFDVFMNGQARSTLFYMNNLKGKLNFYYDYQRVCNDALSPEQAKIIDMDNASPKAIERLKSLGNDTAINAKMHKEIASFFKTKKTI